VVAGIIGIPGRLQSVQAAGFARNLRPTSSDAQFLPLIGDCRSCLPADTAGGGLGFRAKFEFKVLTGAEVRDLI
jgi:hypothetical protein